MFSVSSLFYSPSIPAWMGVTFSLFCFATFQLRKSHRAGITESMAAFIASMPFEFGDDFHSLKSLGKYSSKKSYINTDNFFLGGCAVIFAIFFFVIFVMLFSAASPQIERIAKIFSDLPISIFSNLNIFLVAVLFFAFLPFFNMITFSLFLPALKSYADKFSSDDFMPESRGFLSRLSPYIIAVFCALFSLQNFFDAVYLFGGMKLPEGITYSRYAINGATALGFAVFISLCLILATSFLSPSFRVSKFTKAMLSIWIIQNLFLSVCASARLLSYVSAYDLTTTRIYGFLYFALVVVFLVVILAKLYKNFGFFKMSDIFVYVIFAEMLAVSACDIKAVVADYNVSRFIDGKCEKLDIQYLSVLGVSAIPSVERLLESPKSKGMFIDLDSMKTIASRKRSSFFSFSLVDYFALRNSGK